MATILKMKHSKASDHKTYFATSMGASVSTDSQLHLLFYRDGLQIMEEDVEIDADIDITAPVEGEFPVLSSKINIEQNKEDVVTVIMPKSQIELLFKLFNKLNKPE